MAYEGEIRYTTIYRHGLRSKKEVQFIETEKALCTLLAPLEPISSSCHIKLRNCITGIVRDENKNLIGWIRYDYTNEVTANRLGCISLAEGAVDWSEYTDISHNELVLGNFSYTLLATSAQSGEKG